MENQQTFEKQRHGCVTSIIIFMMIANSAFILLYCFADELLKYNVNVHETDSEKIKSIIFSSFNLISCFLLFQWKKIGFWLFIITHLSVVTLNLYEGKGISQLWSEFVVIAILFGVMQITTKNKKTTWEDLS